MKYVNGPSVLRLDGRTDAPIQPGEAFEADFTPEQEATLIACGALAVAPAPVADTKPPVSAAPINLSAGRSGDASNKE